MALDVVTWNCFPARHEQRTPTQLDAAAPTCWLTLMTSSWLFWSHQTIHQSSGSERGCEAEGHRNTGRKVRTRRRRMMVAVGGGIRWPLGHSLEVHRDRADSQVSRSHTCVSKIYCWVAGLMVPSWCLAINLTGMENCVLFGVWATSKTRERGKERGEKGTAECVSLWCVFCSTLHTLSLHGLSVHLRMSKPKQYNQDRIVCMSMCVCFVKIITRTKCCWVSYICSLPQYGL